MLYERDYLELSKEEKKQIEIAERFWSENQKHNKGISGVVIMKYHELLPIAYYFHTSLFPNNYILNNPLHDKEKTQKLFEDFRSLLDEDSMNERKLLNFIRDKRAYFILEGLFFRYDFGHHDAYLFREFPLHPNFVVDFLLVGKSSGGYEFVFIEFESPNQDITTKDGNLGNGFRKGIKQVEDWDSWIDSNFFSLKSVFSKYKSSSKNLPSEFYELDKTRIHYLVIAGRRSDFNSKTYKIKRQGINNIRIIHYDNLLDDVKISCRLR